MQKFPLPSPLPVQTVNPKVNTQDILDTVEKLHIPQSPNWMELILDNPNVD